MFCSWGDRREREFVWAKKMRGVLLICVSLYRMELLPKLREQSGRESEIGGCV